MKGLYSVLTTDAFILYTRGIGEADRIITVLTRSDGLIDVHGRSVRREGAKMRGAVKPYGRISLSIVRGKRNILKDIAIVDTLDDVWCDEKKYAVFVTLLHHIHTFAPITEYDENLFTIVETAVYFLKNMPSFSAANILLVAQVMLLTALGYVPDMAIIPVHFADILRDVSISSDRRGEFQQHFQNALRHQ